MDLIHIVLRCHSLSEEIIRSYVLEKEERGEGTREGEGEDGWLSSDEEELEFQQVQFCCLSLFFLKIR